MKDYVSMFQKQEEQPKISEENAERMFSELLDASGVALQFEEPAGGTEDKESAARGANYIVGAVVKAYMRGDIENNDDGKGFRVVQRTKPGAELRWRMPLAGDIADAQGEKSLDLLKLAGKLTGAGADVIRRLGGRDARVMTALSSFFSMA